MRHAQLVCYSGGKTNASQPYSGWCTWTMLPLLAAVISAHHGGLRMAVMLPLGLESRTLSSGIATPFCRFTNHASELRPRRFGPLRGWHRLVSRRQTVPDARAGLV